MNSISRTITFIFIFLANNCFAQKVTNISVEQVGQSIQVSYSLESELPCSVSLYYSTDNGANWQGPLQKVNGDVGEKILNGNRKIIWDVLSEIEQLKFSAVAFKVDARLMGLKEVKIGNQIWSAENLNTDRFANGELIPEAKSNEAWLEAGKNQKAAWCYYDNDSTNGPVYGKLYNWYAVADPRGLCPIDWHVPSRQEWSILIDFLGGADSAGDKMKEIGDKHWLSPNENATNCSGFTGLPGGFIFEGFGYAILGNATWWCATQETITEAWDICLVWNKSKIGFENNSSKSSGSSIRCIKD